MLNICDRAVLILETNIYIYISSIIIMIKFIGKIDKFDTDNGFSSNISFFIQAILVSCSRGVVVKAIDCGILVSEFVLQLRKYVHFQENTLGKTMNTLIHYCSSRRMVLAFNNLQRLICD